MLFLSVFPIPCFPVSTTGHRRAYQRRLALQVPTPVEELGRDPNKLVSEPQLELSSTIMEPEDASVSQQFMQQLKELQMEIANVQREMVQRFTSLEVSGSSAGRYQGINAAQTMDSRITAEEGMGMVQVPRARNLEFPVFDGKMNLHEWLFKTQHYFGHYRIPEYNRVSYASYYFSGEALQWFLYFSANKSSLS